MSKWIEGSKNCGIVIFNKKIAPVEQLSKETYDEILIKVIGTEDAIEIPLPYDKLLECFTEEEIKKKDSYFIQTHPRFSLGGGLLLQRYEPNHPYLRVTGFMVEKQPGIMSSSSGRTIMIEGIYFVTLGEEIKSIGRDQVCMQ